MENKLALRYNKIILTNVVNLFKWTFKEKNYDSPNNFYKTVPRFVTFFTLGQLSQKLTEKIQHSQFVLV